MNNFSQTNNFEKRYTKFLMYEETTKNIYF